MITENEFNLLYDAVLDGIEPGLVGPHIVARSEPLPLGVQSVTIHELKKLKGKAKRGQKGAPMPREVADFERKTVQVVDHGHGFQLDDQDLLASRRSQLPLETGAARQCARLVAESVEDMIFNGIPELGIQGIYKDVPKVFKAANGWNTKEGDPYNDIVGMVSSLGETSKYKPKFMVLSPDAYYSLASTNEFGVSYIRMLEEAAIFPNGRDDIYMAPANANPDHDPIIPPGSGLIGDKGVHIAERFVQQIQAERISGDEEHYVDIYLRDFPMNSDNIWDFNVQTFQGIGIHFKDAFLRLENLTKPESKPEPKSESKQSK